MNRKSRSGGQRGFSLLEQAMVLPVLLILIGGAIDINTLLQSYSALQEGVNASLRCVYVTDGKCVSTSSDIRPRRYNYYLVARHPVYLIDTYDFSGTASWINRPVYHFSNFQAQVLSRVEYDAQSANLSISRRYFPAYRTADYVLRTASMPYITGSGRNPAAHYRGARTGMREAHFGNYPSDSLPISSVDLQTDAQDVSSTFEFTVPDGEPNVFESTSFERPPSDDQSAGTFTLPVSKQFADVALHITGNKAKTALGALGGIQIDLQHYLRDEGKWENSASLGAQQLGRAAGEASQANFVIRGLLPEFIDNDVAEYQELHSYSPIRLKYGDRYRVRFTLHSDSGTVGWQGAELKIFYPVQEARSQRFDCQGGMPPCTTGFSCQTSAPAAIFHSAPVIQQELGPVRHDAPILLQSCSSGETSLQDSLSAHGISECSANFDIQLDPGTCPFQTASRNCPAIGTSAGGSPNVGVSQLPATDGKIWNSHEALDICPPPTIGIFGAAQLPRWEVTVAALPSDDVLPGSDGSFSLIKENCAATLQWPLGSSLANYPHLSYAQSAQGFSPHYTDGFDPAAIKADTHSGFACAEFPLANSKVDVEIGSGNDDQHASLFYGVHSKPACDWAEALRLDAIRFNLMPREAFFTANSPALSTEKTLSLIDPPACIDPSPELTWSEPDKRSLLPGGPFEEGELPEDCRKLGNSCQVEFAGFGPGAQGSSTYNFEYASQHFGFNEIQAHYPRARWNCAEKDCASIQVMRDGAFMQAQGSIRVPLYILGRNTVELRYVNRERREEEFIR